MRITKAFLKITFAGILAVAILSGLFSVYSLDAVHIENPRENTDYIWPAGSRWSQMTEGVAWGRMDANGYNNLQAVENPDILFLGSSHIEAKNVMQDENAAYLLGEILGGRYSVYNLGISGHHFLKVCKYLPATMALYEQAPKAIVIETDDVYFRTAEIEHLLEGKIEFTPSHSGSIIALLQKLPFFRLGYNQINGGLLDLLTPARGSSGKTARAAAEKTVDEDAYDKLFAWMRDAVQAKDTRIIIFYHPTETLQSDGSIAFTGTDGAEMFEQKCAEYGFTFVNMQQAFEEMYKNDHDLPHGFANSKIGSGHINADGHRCIAQKLAETIGALEEAGKLCR